MKNDGKKHDMGRRGQCCGTGTGTVGTVTFCLAEPEP
jgi:hypothetical protein